MAENPHSFEELVDQLEAEIRRLQPVVEAAEAFVDARARWHDAIAQRDYPTSTDLVREYDDTMMELVDAVQALAGEKANND